MKPKTANKGFHTRYYYLIYLYYIVICTKVNHIIAHNYTIIITQLRCTVYVQRKRGMKDEKDYFHIKH